MLFVLLAACGSSRQSKATDGHHEREPDAGEHDDGSRHVPVLAPKQDGGHLPSLDRDGAVADAATDAGDAIAELDAAADSAAPVDCPDSDHDFVCDADDQCPGHYDPADFDDDGVPDGCDMCKGRDTVDDDDNGIPDDCDQVLWSGNLIAGNEAGTLSSMLARIEVRDPVTDDVYAKLELPLPIGDTFDMTSTATDQLATELALQHDGMPPTIVVYGERNGTLSTPDTRESSPITDAKQIRRLRLHGVVNVHDYDFTFELRGEP